MLNSITFKKKYRKFPAETVLSFKNGLNFLVGENGCGKTTILSIIQDPKNHPVKMKTTGGKYHFFDFERNNPRIQSQLPPNTSMETTVFLLNSRYVSHGESSLSIINSLHTLDGQVILLDEPDANLSIQSCGQIKKLLTQLADKMQIIACVHNPLVFNDEPEILDVETCQWTNTTDYIHKKINST